MTFEEYLSSLKGKTVGVIGVGVSNRPLIEKLLERGIDVTARDKKEDLGELGQTAKNASISEVMTLPPTTAAASSGTSGRRPGVRKITSWSSPSR